MGIDLLPRIFKSKKSSFFSAQQTTSYHVLYTSQEWRKKNSWIVCFTWACRTALFLDYFECCSILPCMELCILYDIYIFYWKSTHAHQPKIYIHIDSLFSLWNSEEINFIVLFAHKHIECTQHYRFVYCLNGAQKKSKSIGIYSSMNWFSFITYVIVFKYVFRYTQCHVIRFLFATLLDTTT